MNHRIVIVLVGLTVVGVLAFHRAGAPANPPAIQSAPLHSHRASAFKRAQAAVAAAPIVVYVAGAVARPGLYTLKSGARVNDAVQRAGGLRADADAAAINLAERISDGEEIRAVRTGEIVARTTRTRSTRRSKSAKSSKPALGSVNLNTADASALAGLPGVGPTLAQRIVQYREINGPFGSIDELADVAGMSQRRVDSIAAYVTVHDGS